MSEGNGMSPRRKRRIIDFFVWTAVLSLVLFTAPWWVVIPVFVYGMWNFYDGLERGVEICHEVQRETRI